MTPIDRPEDTPEAFQAAWNAHDMAAFASLFHEDATFVNRFAHYVRGVDAIVDLHQPLHETIYRDSTLENALIDATPVGDGAVVVHFWSRLCIGPAHPAGPHDVDTLILAVVTRRDGMWRFQALENVTLANPRTGEAVLRPDMNLTLRRRRVRRAQDRSLLLMRLRVHSLQGPGRSGTIRTPRLR